MLTSIGCGSCCRAQWRGGAVSSGPLMTLKSVRQLGWNELIPQSEHADWGAVVPATRLADQLAHRIATLIDRGEFSEGGRLPAESELADRFGVSRPVIREALSRLRVMGMIISRRGSGSYVQQRSSRAAAAKPTIGFGPVNSMVEVRKCYEFRVGVEGDAAYYAAINRTPDMLVVMQSALQQMEQAVAEGAVGMSA